MNHLQIKKGKIKMKKKTVDEIIQNVDATMKIEGMFLTEGDKQRIRNCYDGKSTVEEEVKKIKENIRDKNS